MDCAVDREPRRVDVVRAVLDLATLEIDLDETRGGDLLEEVSVGIDQEVMLRTRHARRDVREHEIVPAKERHQPVAGGQVDALLPLLRTHARLYGHAPFPGHRTADPVASPMLPLAFTRTRSRSRIRPDP